MESSMLDYCTSCIPSCIPFLTLLLPIFQGYGQYSRIYNINGGVAHGALLGSTLFQAFINDFPDDALLQIGIYTDDTTAYSSINGSALFEQVGPVPCI